MIGNICGSTNSTNVVTVLRECVTIVLPTSLAGSLIGKAMKHPETGLAFRVTVTHLNYETTRKCSGG